MTHTLVSLSGGMDSATVLRWALARGRVSAIGFDYGSKHNYYELELAEKLADYYEIDFHRIDLRKVMAGFKSNLLLTGNAIPEGHYNDASMSQTVVPGRNTIFLAILLGLAQSVKANRIAIGIHQGDHTIYPDCRPAFFRAMRKVISLASENTVQLMAPFLNTDKAGILRFGLRYDVPYWLTRTCYKHQKLSCGKCGSCRERLEAFQKVGRTDPVKYEV
jgi:7-cyano-7-deazaguanine synthase